MGNYSNEFINVDVTVHFSFLHVRCVIPSYDGGSIFPFSWFLLYVFLTVLIRCKHLGLFCLLWIGLFRIMKCPFFLGSGNTFVLKFFYINIAMLAFLINIIYLFYPFNFSLSAFLFLKCMSCKEHLVGSFFIQYENLYPLIGRLSTFIFNVFTDMVGFILPSFQLISSSLFFCVSVPTFIWINLSFFFN